MGKDTLNHLYADHKGKVSDKWAAYLVEYERLFSDYRDLPIKLLEIGIQNGGSLEIWAKYFHRAQVLVGCDINPLCANLSYVDPRITVVVGNANMDAVQAEVLGHASTFDLIIDDGSHLSSDIIKSFARYFPNLADGGVYIVEDLHTSYWQEFEGGLFDPFSSMAFFKRLTDIINHEHWGIDKAHNEILRGFFEKYGFQIEVGALKYIHSVEFVNSICVIRKEAPNKNHLGKRLVVGTDETVTQKQELLSSLERTPNQTSNKWTARDMPPDEELIVRNKDLEKLKQTLLDRDKLIASYSNSLSWRITKPLRFLGRVYSKIIGGN